MFSSLISRLIKIHLLISSAEPYFSPIHLTELAIPHLEKTKGNIVNVSSIASQKTHPSMPFYAVAKAGLDHFARNYASILAPSGVRINNLNPGATDTAIFQRSSIPAEMVEKVILVHLFLLLQPQKEIVNSYIPYTKKSTNFVSN